MTNNNAFKKLVRDRMKNTGETFMQAADGLTQEQPTPKPAVTTEKVDNLKYLDFDTIITSDYVKKFLLEDIFTIASPTLIISGDANSGKTSFLASYFKKLAETKKVHLKPFALYEYYSAAATSPHEDLYKSVDILNSVYGKNNNLSMQYDTNPTKHMVATLNSAFKENVEAFGYDEGKVEKPHRDWYFSVKEPIKNSLTLNGLGIEDMDNGRNGFNETLSHEERRFLFATTYYTRHETTAEEVAENIKRYTSKKDSDKAILQSIEAVKTVTAVLHITKKSKISGPEFSIDFAQI